MNTATWAVTEANEGSEGRPSSSFSSLPSVTRRAFGLSCERNETVARDFEQVTAANVGGRLCLPMRMSRAARIAEFGRSAAGAHESGKRAALAERWGQKDVSEPFFCPHVFAQKPG